MKWTTDRNILVKLTSHMFTIIFSFQISNLQLRPMTSILVAEWPLGSPDYQRSFLNNLQFWKRSNRQGNLSSDHLPNAATLFGVRFLNFYQSDSSKQRPFVNQNINLGFQRWYILHLIELKKDCMYGELLKPKYCCLLKQNFLS